MATINIIDTLASAQVRETTLRLQMSSGGTIGADTMEPQQATSQLERIKKIERQVETLKYNQQQIQDIVNKLVLVHNQRCETFSSQIK